MHKSVRSGLVLAVVCAIPLVSSAQITAVQPAKPTIQSLPPDPKTVASSLIAQKQSHPGPKTIDEWVAANVADPAARPAKKSQLLALQATKDARIKSSAAALAAANITPDTASFLVLQRSKSVSARSVMTAPSTSTSSSPPDPTDAFKASLVSGFSEDPVAVSVHAGQRYAPSAFGATDASCRGLFATYPNYTLEYVAGSAPLRIYADATTDTALMINLPDGSWRCNDDGKVAGYAGQNPVVDLDAPASGVYHVWVGSYAASATNPPARLFVSELKSSLPLPAVSSMSCAGQTCSITQCEPGRYDVDRTLANGCECVDDTSSATCANATDLGVVALGTKKSVTGVIPVAGGDDWYVVSTTGSPVPMLGAGLANGVADGFQIEVRGSCSSGPLTCGLGGNAASIGSFNGQGGGGPVCLFDTNAQRTSTHPTKIFVRVSRTTSGQSCKPYTLTVGAQAYPQ